MKPAFAFATGLGAVLLLALAYFYGRGDGAAIEQAKQAAVERAVVEERKQREQRVSHIGGAAEAQDVQRQSQVREIYRESHTITERPVFRNVCIDADGVRLLDRATATANGDDPRIAAAGTGADPAPVAQP